MPAFQNPKLTKGTNWDSIPEADYEYNYPRGLDLKPGSEFHDTLRDRILERAFESHRVMSSRYPQWRETDRVLRAYVPESFYESTTQQKSGDNNNYDVDRYGYYDKHRRRPKIVLPASYATLETLLTYMTSAFLQKPYFRYKGFGPEDQIGAKLLELVVQQQADRFRAGLAMHTHWRDGFAYGIGAVAVRWTRKTGHRTVLKERGFISEMLGKFFVTDTVRRRSERTTLYEGNQLFNIDPYNALPDPSVPAHEVDKAEFWGWVEDTLNYQSALSLEQEDDEVFNTRYLRHIDGRSQFGRLEGGRRNDEQFGERQSSSTNSPVDVVWMFINLIPQDWELGRGKWPEKWLFGIAGDEVIIQARPLGLTHGEFPIACCAPDYDGYSVVPVARLQVIQDLQLLVDFLYASHVENVRKSVNNQFVIDPYLVNINDVNDPEPGKLIRLRQAAWGKQKLDQAIKQLDVHDVTRGNVQDALVLMDLMDEVTGSTDAAKGMMVNKGPRISSAQYQGSRTSSLSRLAKIAQVISMQSHAPLAHIMASQTQQFMERDTFVEITHGVLESLMRDFGPGTLEVNKGRLGVSPLDLITEYDIEESDATIPGSEDVENWLRVYELAATNPMVASQINMPNMFKHIARQLGAKNIDQFMQQAGPPQVMPDEQVQQEAQAGNLVPIGGDGQAL